jgi:hypothetical protein
VNAGDWANIHAGSVIGAQAGDNVRHCPRFARNSNLRV